MSERITITMREYVYKKYLEEYKGNKSAFIEEMFVRGIEAESSELTDIRTKYIESLKVMQDLEIENNELKRKLGKYKDIHDGRTPEEIAEEEEANRIIDGLKLNNPMRHD